MSFAGAHLEEAKRITGPFPAVVWHLLVTHPALRLTQTKWDGVEGAPARA